MADEATTQARMPLRLGGMGVLKLERNTAAMAAMSAVAGSMGRMAKWAREIRGWGVPRDAALPMAGLEWALDMIENVLRTPEQQGRGPDGMVRAMLGEGWDAVEELRRVKTIHTASERRLDENLTKSTIRRGNTTRYIGHDYSGAICHAV